MTRLSSPAVTTEDLSGAGIAKLAATGTKAEAEEGACAQLSRSPVLFRDETTRVTSGSKFTELAAMISKASRWPEKIPVSFRDKDPTAMEGNEVRGIAMERKLEENTDCNKSGSMRPPAEPILVASGEPPLSPFVESPLNTLAELLLDATAEAELAVSDPDQ
ncbi:hypothetical protein B0H14DRAFT_2618365 [Mycena olivaceomarginata]|nr:hypothetical protein B0H14DRAFT_2618365 [Mycena olivaceomarginata]